ncbi:MAG: hypothetical protein AAGJ17_00040 [Pseudomonadota bacterium]
MNEELQSALTSVIINTADSFKSVKDFTLEQAPDVIKQLLLWNGIYSFIEFVVGLIVISLTVIMCFKVVKISKDENIDIVDDFCFFGIMSFPIGFAFSMLNLSFGIFLLNFDWLKIWIAPKAWLIEYAANLVK